MTTNWAISTEDWKQLTKFRLTSLVGVAAFAGSVLGGAHAADGPAVFAAIIGTWLMGAGAGALNQVWEADLDALMERTRNRPVASGRLGRVPGLVYGAGMALIGALALGLYTNALTLGLGVLSLVSYLLVYTPLKRTTSFCTVVGALPGALPPVMGWTAVRNEISTGAALLFAILFLWQLPHFLAFAWLKREDYAAGGFPMLSVVDPDGDMLARQVLLYCVALLPASLAPSVMGLAGWTYFHVALGLGIALTGFAAALAVFRTPQIARTMFWASLVYLPALLTALMADRILP